MKILILLFLCSTARAALFPLLTAPGPSQTYRLYIGPASRFYTNSVASIGTTCTIACVKGKTNFAAVVTVNASGVESEFSAEVAFLATGTNATLAWDAPPAAPVYDLIFVTWSSNAAGPFFDQSTNASLVITNPNGKPKGFYRLRIQQTNSPPAP
jgi:hypothetical protein